MKRINTTKIMAVLASLCLITSSFVGSTLAKYITTANSNDAARVAKFGVVLQADGNLFGQNYVDDISMDTEAAALAVQSSADLMEPTGIDDVVAPGTKNDAGLHFSVTGKPEVATRLEAVITHDNIFIKGDYINRVPQSYKVAFGTLVKAPTVTENSFVANKYFYKEGTEYIYSPTYIADKEWYTPANLDNDTAKFEETRLTGGYFPVTFEASDYTSGNAGKEDTADIIAKLYANKLANIASVDGEGNVTPIVAGIPTGTVTEGVSDDGKKIYTVVAEYPPNFDYADLGVENETIKWEWQFNDGNYTYQRLDTALGNLICAKSDSLPENAVMVIGNGTADSLDGLAGSGAEVRRFTSEIPENLYNLETGFGIEITVTQLDDAAN